MFDIPVLSYCSSGTVLYSRTIIISNSSKDCTGIYTVLKYCLIVLYWILFMFDISVL